MEIDNLEDIDYESLLRNGKGDDDDCDKEVGYNNDDDDANDNNNDAANQEMHPFQAKTLMDLSRGANAAVANQERENKMYMLLCVCNFISLRLVNSSGGRPPYLFDKETRE